jgi:hypothetical protein
MNLESFRLLRTSQGEAALAAALSLSPREESFLSCFTTLSRNYSPDLARAALETAILRGEAISKFPRADQMYFTREALEQASSSVISTYRACRLEGYQPLFDLGCSIGSDLYALAGHAPAIGVDIDPLRLEMAQANLAALNPLHPSVLVRANLLDSLPFTPPTGCAFFFDPARRNARRRAVSVREYQPPLHIVQQWTEYLPEGAVKISPGVQLPEIDRYDAEVEFISLKGELKEAVLWFGALKTARRRATLLPGGNTLYENGKTAAIPTRQPGAILYEPDPAILRAGLVRQLAGLLGAAQLDPGIAYLTADTQQPTPFARAWQTEAWFPFSLKRLRSELRARGVGRLTVKKRGSPLQPEDLIRELRLKGDAERVVFLTHLQGKPIAVIAMT